MKPTGPAGLARGDPSSALRELGRGPEAGSTGGGVHRANASCGISLEHASAGVVVCSAPRPNAPRFPRPKT